MLPPSSALSILREIVAVLSVLFYLEHALGSPVSAVILLLAGIALFLLFFWGLASEAKPEFLLLFLPWELVQISSTHTTFCWRRRALVSGCVLGRDLSIGFCCFRPQRWTGAVVFLILAYNLGWWGGTLRCGSRANTAVVFSYLVLSVLSFFFFFNNIWLSCSYTPQVLSNVRKAFYLT